MDQEQRYEQARKQVLRVRQFYIHLVVYVLVNALLVVLSLTRDGTWSIWPLLGWGIGLTAHGVTVLFSGELLGSGWQERQIRRRLERSE